MKRPRVYHDRRPLILALRVAAIGAATAAALSVFAFFWCRRYIVIENGVLHLDPPWSAQTASD